jgi:hypothetical protein
MLAAMSSLSARCGSGLTLQPLTPLQNRHVPALACEFVAQPGDGGVLQHPERLAVGKATDLTEQVGDDLALVVLDGKASSSGRNPLAAEQPVLQLMAARRAFGIVVIAVAVTFALKGCEPFLLLAAAGGGQQLEVFRLDAAVAVGVLDSGEQVGEREALFDVEFGNTESERDIGDAAPLFEQSREGLVFLQFVHRRARDILDQGSFHRARVVAVHGNRTRHQHLVGRDALFFGNLGGREVTPPSGDDLVTLAVGTNQQRLQDATRADRWQDVGNVGWFAAVAHVDGCDLQIAERDMLQVHGLSPLV